MCFKAYRIEDPGKDDRPIKRLASLEYWKKALSDFFNTTQKWNEVTQTGNPTQSKRVNTLIKVVKRAETRGTGAEAKADRALTSVRANLRGCLI
mmetsp:Transcript_21768/g.44606  ORF Transcript_21768/g.44606 Transcript_21768/m.44606 type:complete len:94 (-) Transcript_21768:1998-2279(-)